MFRATATAKARAREISTIERAEPIIGSEYDYLGGDILIRVSPDLTPAQASTYGKAGHAKVYGG
ncbi:MAG: hypothetical protein ACREN1_01555 [Candidatus Dormibacteria bacterium]